MITTPSQAGQIGGEYRRRAAVKRKERVLMLHCAGMSQKEIAKQLHITWRTVYRDLAEIQDARVEVEQIIEDAGIDAHDAWLTLSRMHDADLSDIVLNPDAPLEELKYKPIAQWPAIWRQGLAGKIRITPVAVSDGERTEGGDTVRYKVEIERADLLKIIELAGRLKPVDAFVKQQQADVNITVVTADEARRVAGARRRLALAEGSDIIDVSPAPEATSDPKAAPQPVEPGHVA